MPGGGHFRRAVAIDELQWDGDRILPVSPTRANPPEFRLTNNLARDAKAERIIHASNRR